MGEHNVEQHVDEKKAQAFMKALLEDLRALAFMLEDGRIESGVTRIGAEQEMFLDRSLSATGSCFIGGSEACKRRATDNRDCAIQSRSQSHSARTHEQLFQPDGTMSSVELIELARNSAATQAPMFFSPAFCQRCRSRI